MVSVPHSGRDYPEGVADRLTVPLHRVRALEDAFADRLADGVIARGGRVLIARTPRLIVDLNRAETDFDPIDFAGAPHGRPTAKARGGLGVVPTRLAGVGQLWREPMRPQRLMQIIARDHRPYHAAIARELHDVRRRRGGAVLVDLHSMPPLTGVRAPHVVIGDRRGASATGLLIAVARAVFQRHGLRVGLNMPYAGGHIVERHAVPGFNVFALQIEIDRSLYLDDRLEAPGPGLTRMSRIVAELVQDIDATLARVTTEIAAE